MKEDNTDYEDGDDIKKNKSGYFNSRYFFSRLSMINGLMSKLDKFITGNKDSEKKKTEVEQGKDLYSKMKTLRSEYADYYKRLNKGEKIKYDIKLMNLQPIEKEVDKFFIMLSKKNYD